MSGLKSLYPLLQLSHVSLSAVSVYFLVFQLPFKHDCRVLQSACTVLHIYAACFQLQALLVFGVEFLPQTRHLLVVGHFAHFQLFLQTFDLLFGIGETSLEIGTALTI